MHLRTAQPARAARTRRTVTACCLSAGKHPARLAAVLALLRPVVDEVVVAVDDRCEGAAEVLGDVTDRIVLVPYREPSDRPIAWLFGLCGGDWIFNIDDDEVPSRALLEELPALARRSEISHAWIARRWLYPDTSTFLDETPWNQEYQLRFVRSDPLFLHFSDEFHRPVICDGPMRFVEAPLWHLDTAVNSRERRLTKALAYEQARPGMRVGQFSHSTGFYVPELRGKLQVAAVPADDMRLIECVLEARTPTACAAPTERATRDEIDEAWPGDPHPSSLYDARIELIAPTGPLVAEVRQTLPVRLTNLGERPWPRGGAITVGTRWEGRAEGVRTSLPATVAPGEAISVPVHIDPPGGDRFRSLEIDLVHEHVRWFGKSIEVTVEVVPRRRIALLGSGERVAEVLRALLVVPIVEPVILDWDLVESPRYGHQRVGGIGRYLFGSCGTARVGALLRAGRVIYRPSAHLALEGFERLLVVGDGLRSTAPPRRERLYVLTTVAAARRLGVPVTQVVSDEPSADLFRRALRRFASGTSFDAVSALLAPSGHDDRSLNEPRAFTAP
jgi:hypothetical protein